MSIFSCAKFIGICGYKHFYYMVIFYSTDEMKQNILLGILMILKHCGSC